MARPHGDEDPGWFAGHAVRAVIAPGRDRGASPTADVNALEVLRGLFTVFLAGLGMYGLGVGILSATGAGVGSMAAAPVAGGVAAYGVLSLVLARVLDRPFDCSSPLTLVGSYRSRFFVRIAIAESAGLLGFVGFVLSDEWWMYPLGLGFALIGFARLAPTRRNLERVQDELHTTGCGHSLLAALTAPAPQR